jgi:ADP-heptose:LPS heptosyltransferase
MAVARNNPSILIVRRDNVGDLVCTTPLIEALRARHPQAWIGALVNTYNAGVLERNPSLDAVFAYEKLKHRSGSLLANVLHTVKTLARLRIARLDYALVPHGTPQALKLAAALKPRRLIAGDTTYSGTRHEVERVFALGASLGLLGAPGPMRLYPDPALQARVRSHIEKCVGSGPVAAVHISARQEIRRWPLERYAEAIKVISSKQKVALMWSPGPRSDPRHPGDDEAAARLLDLLKEEKNVAALPTPDLATLIAAVSQIDWMLCPDGGALHIAAAFGKPVVALWGDSPVTQWRPWQVQNVVVQPPTRNLADLPLLPVLDACAALARMRGGDDQHQHGEEGVGQRPLG